MHKKEVVGKDANRDAAKKPDEFEGKDWNRFHKTMGAYLHLLKAVTSIPLIYVIRKEDHPPDIKTNYANDRYGELIARAPLSRTTYGKDNHCMFQIIKGLVLKGPAYAWIQLQEAANDGRRAWKSLTAHYDGVNNKTMTKDEAYNLIWTFLYMGKKCHFNFQKYLTIHIKAHQDLVDNREPMPVSRKVREFFDHINCNEMEARVANVLADEGKSENYIATANYLSFFACKQMSLSETENRGRSIGSASHKDRCGRGRGHRPGQGGRGKGHGSTNGRGTRNHGKPKEGSTFIAVTMWAKPPPTIQSMIRDQRTSFTALKREVSAINTGRNRVEEDSCYDGDDTETASEQFGRKAPRSIQNKKKPE
jgi:hypothetical protein